MERWLPVARAPWLEISDLGRLRNAASGRILRLSTSHGYPYRHDKGVPVVIHREVLSAFDRPRPPGMECAHLNGDRTDARLTNLRWVTREENCQHKWAHGTMPAGDRAPWAKISRENAVDIIVRCRRGESQRAVAALHGISQREVGRIVRGEAWRVVLAAERAA